MANNSILIVSDGTGETAYRLLKAAMRQFEAEVLMTRYANVRQTSQIDQILAGRLKKNTLVVYTFVTPELRRHIQEKAGEQGIATIDVLGPVLDKIAAVFHIQPVAKPGLLHQVDEEYFERVDAIEFTIRHDDGESVEDLDKADIVIVGVSRTSKSPLAFYLAQEGWRVANIPVVVGAKIPSQVFKVDQRKVVGLTIDPARLAEARRVRLKQLGVEDSSYGDLARVREELEYAHAIFQQNPSWPVIDVTGKSIEEVAQEVLDELLGKGRKL